MNIPLKQYWGLLVDYLRPQRLRVLLLAMLLLSSIGLELANPQILRYFIDAAQSGAELRSLLIAAILFLGIAVTQQIVAVFATYLSENVAWTATNLLRADLAAHCLRLDLGFHKVHTPGEIIERIDGDVNELSNFFSRLFIGLIGNFALLLGVLVLLFREDWRVGTGLSIFTAVSLVVLLRLRSIAVPYWTAVRAAAGEFFGFLGEVLGGTEDVRANRATGYVMQRFHETLQRLLRLNRKASIAGYSMWIATLGVFAVGNAVAFGLSAYLWSAGAITIGTVYLIFHYTELLRRPIDQIRTQVQDLQKASGSIVRIQELLETRSRIDAGGDLPLPDGALAVELQHISFGYEPDVPVLRDLSLRLEPGRVLGLLGRTGSGKTTLARLLLRFYDPVEGVLRLGDVPAPEAPLARLRQRVGIVTQDVQLFQASVRDNLTFFNPAVPDARIVEVLDDLGLMPWYRALPVGLDSMLQAGGGGLSAGEAQLLAFARLFLVDPGLVILDEASSRLDPATEALIERAVDRLLLNRTAIIIAHRLATVERADEILILEDGRVKEYGARRQLVEDRESHFAHLLQSGMAEVLV